jgi:D-3-phosphoglycerate dehydrogenase
MAAPGPFHFVVAEPFHPAAMERLRQHGTVEELTDTSPETLLNAVGKADALLIRSRAHVTAKILDAAPRLRVIGRAAPSFDHIDLRMARQRAIGVVYSPAAATRTAVEFTVAMILAAQRRLIYFDRRVRAGEFAALRVPTTRGLYGTHVGLIGMNAVAEGVGKILVGAFGSHVVYFDPAGRRPSEQDAREASLEDLLRRCAVVSLHLTLQPATRHILNAERLALLGSEAIVVNTARGGLIDSMALAEALKNGRLGGAALDVFESEPLPANHPLRNAPNCILTPHIGCLTRDSEEAACDVVDDVLRVLRGDAPCYPVPPEQDGGQE